MTQKEYNNLMNVDFERQYFNVFLQYKVSQGTRKKTLWAVKKINPLPAKRLWQLETCLMVAR